jgi:hypothetical protein
LLHQTVPKGKWKRRKGCCFFMAKVRKVEEGRRLRDRPSGENRKNCRKVGEGQKRWHKKDEKLIHVCEK